MNETTHRNQISDAVVERDEAAALGGSARRAEGGIPRIVVRFIGYSRRPIDPDNFAGSIKDLLDGCRHAGLIPGDEAWRIRLETEQIKVAHIEEEKIVLEIEEID